MVVTRKMSPDIPFDRSINPYRGCEHGCIYCFARPTHAFLGLSPGLDFESKLFMKPDAPQLLERELSARSYEPRVIAIGTNTDPYQPIERRHEIMRRILGMRLGSRAGHPVGIVTKSNLVTMTSTFSSMARAPQSRARRHFRDACSTPSFHASDGAARADPIAAARRRCGNSQPPAFPTTVMVAPVVLAINDAEIERILDAAAACGVEAAGYVLLRLLLEVRDLFREWLQANFPDRERHVFALDPAECAAARITMRPSASG